MPREGVRWNEVHVIGSYWEGGSPAEVVGGHGRGHWISYCNGSVLVVLCVVVCCRR